MGDIASIIKRMALEAVKAESLTKLIFAELVSLYPISFNLGTNLMIGSDFCVMSKTVTNLFETQSVKVGDKFAIVRQDGGQLYFVVDMI